MNNYPWGVFGTLFGCTDGLNSLTNCCHLQPQPAPPYLVLRAHVDPGDASGGVGDDGVSTGEHNGADGDLGDPQRLLYLTRQIIEPVCPGLRPLLRGLAGEDLATAPQAEVNEGPSSSQATEEAELTPPAPPSPTPEPSSSLASAPPAAAEANAIVHSGGSDDARGVFALPSEERGLDGEAAAAAAAAGNYHKNGDGERTETVGEKTPVPPAAGNYVPGGLEDSPRDSASPVTPPPEEEGVERVATENKGAAAAEDGDFIQKDNITISTDAPSAAKLFDRSRPVTPLVSPPPPAVHGQAQGYFGMPQIV